MPRPVRIDRSDTSFATVWIAPARHVRNPAILDGGLNSRGANARLPQLPTTILWLWT
jgi:hypothetical protein